MRKKEDPGQAGTPPMEFWKRFPPKVVRDSSEALTSGGPGLGFRDL
jgi:hypothetical protein